MWDWLGSSLGGFLGPGLGPVLAAPFVGSFLGVLIRRIPAGRAVVLGRSACEVCGAAIAMRDLVPLWSFVWLRGRCRACGGVIAGQHWQVELAALGVALWAGIADEGTLSGVPGGMGRVWVDCGLGWTLLTLGWIDWETMRLPDALTLPLVLAGLGATWWLEPEAVTDHAIAAALGYLAFAGVAAGYRALRGREGLGAGDAKLLAALGAWTGLDGLPWVVLGGALGGLVAALGLRLRGQSVVRDTAIPFGPCLALAGWVVRMHS